MAFDIGTLFETLAKGATGFGTGIREKEIQESEIQRRALQRALAEAELEQAREELLFRQSQEERLRRELDLRFEQEKRLADQFKTRSEQETEQVEREEREQAAERVLLQNEADTWRRILPPEVLAALGDNPSPEALVSLGRTYSRNFLRPFAPEEGEESGILGPDARLEDISDEGRAVIEEIVSKAATGEIPLNDPEIKEIRETYPLLYFNDFVPMLQEATRRLQDQSSAAVQAEEAREARRLEALRRKRSPDPRLVP